MKPGIRLQAFIGVVGIVFAGSALAARTAVIVEFDAPPAAVHVAEARASGSPLSDDQVQSLRSDLEARHAQFIDNLEARGVDFEVQSIDVQNYDGSVAATIDLEYTLVFNGIALNLEQADFATVAAMDGVKKVHRDRLYHPSLDTSVDYINAPDLYGSFEELTRFDDHREGLEGQGMIISIIDTGVEWQHTMFGGDPTPPRLGVLQEPPTLVGSNDKVIYYIPLADVAAEDGYGHGTHVASTAAGYLGYAQGPDGLPNTADDIPLHGVAPQAKLMSYKVCSDVGSTLGSLGLPTPIACTGSAILLAIEDSVSPRTVTGFVKPVADVINMSLGGSGGPDSPNAIASDNAVKMGAIVVAAAGNSGPGEGTVGQPSVARRAISVAASTKPEAEGEPSSTGDHFADVLDPSTIDRASSGAVVPAAPLMAAANERQDIQIFPMTGSAPLPEGALGQYFVYVAEGSVFTGWPASADGRIALVDAGLPTTYAQIAANAELAGAEAVLFINADPGANAFSSEVPIFVVLEDNAPYLFGLITGDPGTEPQTGDLSSLPLRLEEEFLPPGGFEGGIANFSSRGPVQGYGQVKPDIAAPGVNVLAAAPPASLVGAIGLLGNQVGYSAIDGTSMATPHVAGSAALIKQAHPDWNADMVRTAMMNTATNTRDESGVPKADSEAETILAQGGGLIDVPAASNTPALMGVTGDGVTEPTILGSHSFGEMPLINNRCEITRQVDVTIRDLSGSGGTYALSTANNRLTNHAGISFDHPASVSVPAGGEASFTTSVTFDGNQVREGFLRQLQWYVQADGDNGASLRMPMYLRAIWSLPARAVQDVENFNGILLASDQNEPLVGGGVTYEDIPVQVGEATYRLQGNLDFDQIVEGSYPDVELFLFGPNDNEEPIAQSTNPGGPESIDIVVTEPGTYTWRVEGWVSAATQWELESIQHRSEVPAPQLAAIDSEYENQSGESVDFDGSYTLEWNAVEHATGYELERSVNGGGWNVIAQLDAGTTSYTISSQGNGDYAYRVRTMTAGQICTYVTAASNERAVTVDHREQVDISVSVSVKLERASLDNGEYEMDLALVNDSGTDWLNPVTLDVVGITPSDIGVEAINADNGGSGTSPEDPARYGYAGQVGDETFAAGERSTARTLRFADPENQLFQLDTVVRAYRRVQ